MGAEYAARRRDSQLLSELGDRVLIAADVASVTAEWLAKIAIETERIALLFKRYGREIRYGHYSFKLIEADPDTPTNFAILVRRVAPARIKLRTYGEE